MKEVKLILVLVWGLGVSVYAKETNREKAETVANKATDSVKSSYRHTTEKICEVVNGKEKCIERKIRDTTLNTVDKVKTKAIEVKNKID